MNLIRANMQLVSEDDIISIMRKDAETLTTNWEKFVKSNHLGYYIITNTWLMIIQQYSKWGWMRVLDHIVKHGLVATIKAADTAASNLVQDVPIENSLFRTIVHDVEMNYFISNVPDNPGLAINKDFMASAMFVLRYPKRFSPVAADKIVKQSLLDFIATENRTKLIQRRGYPHWLIKELREKALTLIDWDKLCDQLNNVTIDEIEFTTGAGFDSKSSLGSKLRAISEKHSEYFPPIFGAYTTGAYNSKQERYDHTGQEVRAVKVEAVPKSYKASRIIAMEDTYRQSLSRRYFSICDQFTPDGIPIHDQSVNQRIALEGSIHGGYATTDLSHASDCISKLLAKDILPYNFMCIIEPILGNYTLIDGTYRLMQQLSTAGNSMTFWLESLIFYIIALVAEDIYYRFSGNTRPDDHDLIVPSVYGDDIETHTECTDTLHDILKILGFIVNSDKSFWNYSNLFRESCGIECLNGMDVSSLYFPRTPIKGTIHGQVKLQKDTKLDGFTGEYYDSTMSLVSLQHRLYYACYNASRFLFEVIREAHPKMTTSVAGSTNDDCWEYEDTFVPRRAPAGHIEKVPLIVGPLSGVVRKWQRNMIRDQVDQDRKAKYLPRVTFEVSDKEEISDKDKRLYDCYRYVQFLKHGPRYSDPLMELLKVSERPKSIKEIFGEPTMKWGLSEIDYE
jgi:hypothetical protein